MSDEELTRAERNEVFTANDAQRAGIPVRNVMKDDFAYEVPVETVPLPSMGTVYSTESPLFRQETIDIMRPVVEAAVEWCVFDSDAEVSGPVLMNAVRAYLAAEESSE